MPRPKNPDAPSQAERQARWRAGLRARGERERSVRLSAGNDAKAESLMDQRGLDFGALVNDLIARA